MKRTMMMAALLAAAGTQAKEVTIVTTADAPIIEHVNWFNDNLGAQEDMFVGRFGDGYTDPVVGPREWMLIRWDLSSILPGATISNVTFEIQGTESEVIDTDVFVIDTGAWTEMGVTWSNFNANSTWTHLGTMHDTPWNEGVTTFNNSNLTTVVQEWVSGDRENLGLVFQYLGDPPSGGVIEGDNFVAREWTDINRPYIPGQLVITYAPQLLPDPSTIISFNLVSSDIMEMVIDCPTPVLSYPKITTDLTAVPWSNAAFSTNIGGPYAVTNLGTVAGTNTIYIEVNDAAAFYGIGGKD